MILAAIAISLGAILNRARGTEWWDHSNDTGGRWGMAAGMGLIAASLVLPDLRLAGEVALWVAMSMFFWAVFPWDAYWSAAIGHDATHSRLWGLGWLTLRHSLGIPCLIGLSWLTGHYTPFIAGPLLFGLPYYISGYATPGANVIRNAELAVGGMWCLWYILILQ